MKNGKILIIEEEIIIATELQMRLEARGFQVVALAKSAEEGIKLALKLKPDLILTEIVFRGELDGIEAVKRINKLHKIPVVYVTTLSYLETDPRVVATNPVDFISKPVDDKMLFEVINNIKL